MNADFIMNDTPINQYMEANVNMTDDGMLFSTSKKCVNIACEKQMIFDSPVEPDEHNRTAACEYESWILAQLQRSFAQIQIKE